MIKVNVRCVNLLLVTRFARDKYTYQALLLKLFEHKQYQGSI